MIGAEAPARDVGTVAFRVRESVGSPPSRIASSSPMRVARSSEARGPVPRSPAWRARSLPMIAASCRWSPSARTASAARAKVVRQHGRLLGRSALPTTSTMLLRA